MTAVTDAPFCAADTSGCITCGDVAIPLIVIDVVDGGNADCRDDDAPSDGRVERVATDLVGEVTIGDRLLVHASVAIAHLGPMPEGVTA